MGDASNAYEACAAQFINARDPSSIGASTVDRWAKSIPNKASLLELGCGTGYPITRKISKLDLQYYAVDSSPTLIKLFRARFSSISTQCVRVQDFDYFDQKFDAVLAVGLIFRLTDEDQMNLISRISNALNVHGQFLFSAPSQIVHWKDICAGCECLSLGQAKYEEILQEAGFRFLTTYMDEGKNYYYEAQRI